MNGEYHIKVYDNKKSYEFDIKYNISIIRGEFIGEK